MDDFIAAAEAEEGRLVEELSRNPVYRRLQAVRSVLDAYRAPAPAARSPAVVDRTQALVYRTHVRPGSKAAQIRPVVLEYLRAKGGRAQTGELMEIVTKAGIEIGGQKPTGALSSYLSNMPELDHQHGEGYGIREEQALVAEPDAPSVPTNPSPADKPGNLSHFPGGAFDATKVPPMDPDETAEPAPEGAGPDGDELDEGSGT